MTGLDHRKAMIEFCRLAHAKGYMAATDGNLSVRLAGGNILITPAGRSKAFIQPQDLVELDSKGQVLSGADPSAETPLHQAVYKTRPEVHAVVHAHPPQAAARSAAGLELDPAPLPEVLVGLGGIPTIPYATPGGEELARAVKPYLAGHDAMVLGHHGSLTLGPDLEKAWGRTEKLEQAALILNTADSLGGARPLPVEEQRRLRARGGHAQTTAPGPLSERVEYIQLPDTTEFAVEKLHRGPRGDAHLIVDGRPLQRVAFLTLKAGAGYRGGHLHHHKHEGFYVVSGRARVELVCRKSGEALALELEPGGRLWIQPGIAHRIEALEDLGFVEFTDRAYDPDDDLPFDFTVR